MIIFVSADERRHQAATRLSGGVGGTRLKPAPVPIICYAVSGKKSVGLLFYAVPRVESNVAIR